MTNDELAADVEAAIREYGRPILVEKSIAFTPDDLYADAEEEVAYEEGVEVLGVPAYGRISEGVLSAQMDASLVYTGSITFSSRMLRTALDEGDVYQALRLTDRLRFDGKAWRVCHLHLTAQSRGEPLVVLAFFDGVKGETL